MTGQLASLCNVMMATTSSTHGRTGESWHDALTSWSVVMHFAFHGAEKVHSILLQLNATRKMLVVLAEAVWHFFLGFVRLHTIYAH